MHCLVILKHCMIRKSDLVIFSIVTVALVSCFLGAIYTHADLFLDVGPHYAARRLVARVVCGYVMRLIWILLLW